MPQLSIITTKLQPFGNQWQANGGKLSRTPPYSSSQLGKVFDDEVGKCLSIMLGSIPIEKPYKSSLLPPQPDCVEVGDCRIIGGVRPQNFDVAYRPDGVRFAFDSKTLNDDKSVRKNYQNMINDLGTQATTVHTRYPYAIVAFLVAIPDPCLRSPQRESLTETLERITDRASELNSNHKAEVISLVVWDPYNGNIDPNCPSHNSPLSIETFSSQVEKVYRERYKGLPPHV